MSNDNGKDGPAFDPAMNAPIRHGVLPGPDGQPIYVWQVFMSPQGLKIDGPKNVNLILTMAGRLVQLMSQHVQAKEPSKIVSAPASILSAIRGPRQ
jgi:hypothetical protein